MCINPEHLFYDFLYIFIMVILVVQCTYDISPNERIRKKYISAFLSSFFSFYTTNISEILKPKIEKFLAIVKRT